MSPIVTAALAVAVAGSASLLALPAALAARSAEGFVCRPGAVPATINARPACLTTGAPCAIRLERHYARYGFHCDRGRLGVKQKAAPAPPAAATPPPAPAPTTTTTTTTTTSTTTTPAPAAPAPDAAGGG